MSSSSHRAALERLGLDGQRVEVLARYLELVERWSVRVNLTGARAPDERVAVLVAPVLQALPALAGARDLIDIGSGNGSPGLVLALLSPGLAVRLLEPRTRRWAFLREAVRAAGVRGVDVLRERHDEHGGGAADRVSLRALRLPLGELGRLLRPGGQLLSWGPPWTLEPGWQVSSRATGFQVLERCST